MYDFITTICTFETVSIALSGLIGIVLVESGYRRRTIIGKIEMVAGGSIILFAIGFQFMLLEMPYLLVGLALIVIPVALMLSTILSHNNSRKGITMIIAYLVATIGTFIFWVLFFTTDLRALKQENSPYVTVEVKPAVEYSLKELYDGKYLIADGGYQYELLPNNDTEDLERVVSPGEAIKILPLTEGDQPHLTIAETWQHAHCPGVKSPYGDASYLVERTVTIYVSLDQTAIAYSNP